MKREIRETRRGGAPIPRRAVFAGLGLAAMAAVLPPAGAAADTIGGTYWIHTVTKGAWVANFDRSLNGIPFKLSFWVSSATMQSDYSWRVTIRFSKAITHPSSMPHERIWFNAALYVLADGRQVAAIDPGQTEIPTGQTFSPSSGYTTLTVKSGGSVHITSKGRSYSSGVTSVGSSYFNFYLKAPFCIKSSAGSGGSIDPAGTSYVTPGSSKGYSFKPNEGYRVADVLVDGKSVGARDSYAFSNVQTNHTISVAFEPDTALVRYHIDGSDDAVFEEEVQIGADHAVPAAATEAAAAEGCTPGFSGWYTSLPSTDPSAPGATPYAGSTITGDLDLYGRNFCTVSFGFAEGSIESGDVGALHVSPDASSTEVAIEVPDPIVRARGTLVNLAPPEPSGGSRAWFEEPKDGASVWRAVTAEGWFPDPAGAAGASNAFAAERDCGRYGLWSIASFEGVKGNAR